MLHGLERVAQPGASSRDCKAVEAGRAAAPTHAVETVFQTPGKRRCSRVRVHLLSQRDWQVTCLSLVHEVKAPPWAAMALARASPRRAHLSLTLPSNWGPARSNRKLSRPGSCLRAKLQSFSTDSRPSELDCFECGAEQKLLRVAVTEACWACSGVKTLDSWEPTISSSICDKAAAGREKSGIQNCGEIRPQRALRVEQCCDKQVRVASEQ